MEDVIYQTEDRSRFRGSTDWRAIWAGLFSFIAIWSVFGLLGFALLAPTPGAGPLMPRVTDGMGIWAAILTIVAMFVAGIVTGRLAGVSAQYQAAMHGMVMFGLGVTAAVVLTSAGGLLFAGLAAGASIHENVIGIFGGSAWIAFVGLFLGWLAAMLGASSGFMRKTALASNVSNVRDIRPAA